MYSEPIFKTLRHYWQEQGSPMSGLLGLSLDLQTQVVQSTPGSSEFFKQFTDLLGAPSGEQTFASPLNCTMPSLQATLAAVVVPQTASPLHAAWTNIAIDSRRQHVKRPPKTILTQSFTFFLIFISPIGKVLKLKFTSDCLM
jgi:hypothetical protein